MTLVINASFLKGNSFQSIVATDGTLSYAIFTYHCGSLNWIPNSASIGFSITQDFFANHELSLTPNVNDVACINGEWSNIIHKVGYTGMLETTYT